jgi:anti-sigma-K factor RskA
VTPVQERIEELAALCAAGAASASERAELDALAAQNPAVRDLVRDYEDAASLLAMDLAPLPPPAGALDRVRQRLGAGGSGAGGSGGMPGLPPRMPGPGADVVPLATRRRAPIVAAVVLPLAAAAVFAFFWQEERGRGDDLAARAAALEAESQNERRVRTRAVEEAARLERRVIELQGTLAKVQGTLGTPELKLATVKSDQSPAVVKVLLDPLTGNWYVLAFHMSPAPADKDYQLWFLDRKGGNPVPSQVLSPGPSGSFHVLTQVPAGVDPAGAAISLEPKGGSPTGSPSQVVMGGPLL